MRRQLTVLATLGALGLSACVPGSPPRPPAATTPSTAPAATSTSTSTPPTTPTTSPSTTTTAASGAAAPVIGAFSAAIGTGSAPVTTAFTWAISDPNGDPLTCRIDLDANGTTETLIPGCTSASIRTATFPTAGTYSVRFEVSDASSTSTATSVVTVGTSMSDSFAITLRFNGTMTSGQQNTFNNAAARWAALVKGGLPAVNLNIGADDCIAGAPAFNGSIDDLMIDALIVPIDGPSNVLGSAGPCYVRVSGGLPLYGAMRFDSADVPGLEASGRFEATILHEMGHVMGIGTLWQSPLFTGAGSSTPLFNGLAARGSWQAIGGTGSVPIENTGGPGTRDGHWNEATFDNELMTGWLDAGSNPLSRMTVAALGDMGYRVDTTLADAYGLPGLRMLGMSIRNDAHEGGRDEPGDLAHGEQLIRPIGAR